MVAAPARVAPPVAGAADVHRRLVDAAGNVRLGIFTEAIHEINHRDFRLTDAFDRPVGRLRRHFAFNQFQFLGILSAALVCGCAIADIGYAGTAFAYCYEPATHRLSEHSFARPFGIGVRCTQTPEDGAAWFRAGSTDITMTGCSRSGERRLQVRLADLSVDAVFAERDPTIQPMLICTRAGATGWVFARKTAGVRVTGSVRWGRTTYDLEAIGARGHHDWSAGYMRRETFWNWGCLAGALPDGRSIGMNVSCGVNETSFTENCFWVDGRLHKLDTVHFDYDRRDPMRPWRVTSFDGRCRLEFQPEGKHVERVNAWLAASNFTQLIGRYTGSLTTAAGEHVPIAGVLGYAETHYAKW